MSTEPLVSQQIRSPNKFLWCVRTYLDLVSRDVPLVPGTGIKTLYALSSGVATLSDTDITAIVAKSERMGLIPRDLRDFMYRSIAKNMWIYGRELQIMIRGRMVDIANGDIRNPDPVLKFSNDEARRYFYVPPFNLIRRISNALDEDTGIRSYRDTLSSVSKLQEVTVDAGLLLTRMQGDEGHVTPTQTSWGALSDLVDRLVTILETESLVASVEKDYRRLSRPALTLLWFIGKLLMGDLSVRPERKDLNMVDLDRELCFTDGTLAAIPFPTKDTVKVFQDSGPRGLTPRGTMYLSSISGAAFYRSATDARDLG